MTFAEAYAHVNANPNARYQTTEIKQLSLRGQLSRRGEPIWEKKHCGLLLTMSMYTNVVGTIKQTALEAT